MQIRYRFLLLLALFIFGLWADDSPQTGRQQDVSPAVDVLIFKNGERLAGRFVRSDGAKVVFQSESLGSVTVPWSKIQDLQSEQVFAVIGKEMKLRKGEDPKKFPQGKIALKGENLLVRNPADGDISLPLKETNHVLDESSFEDAISRPVGLLQGWKGNLTGGISVVEATQTSQTYNAAINLIRATPRESWLDPRQRTLLNVNGVYGKLTQPNATRLKTEILHADFEHDVYFTQRLFAFGQTTVDHNFSQGLDLAQNYGGGIGWTVMKQERSEMDLRSSLIYLNQQFADPTRDQNLVGSIFAQSFTQRFRRDTMLTQHLTATPAWNNLNAYSATGDITLTVPVYRKLLFTVGVLNTFINNPSPGFQKNSFQATTGLTFAIR